MAIKKSNEIANESDSVYNKAKEVIANIEERKDDSTDNDNPYDDIIQYLTKKIDELVDEVNNIKDALGG